jgi:hypothetical protein
LPKLRAAFPTPAKEASDAITQVQFGLRYGNYIKALEALDALVNVPSLTEDQKKVVNEVIDQVKQAINKQPAPAQ